MKSQSKVTKNYRCEKADDGAGTIVKSHGKLIWGHKASVLDLPRQRVALDVTAVTDAATFDGETLLPHVEMFFENLPKLSHGSIEFFMTALAIMGS